MGFSGDDGLGLRLGAKDLEFRVYGFRVQDLGFWDWGN